MLTAIHHLLCSGEEEKSLMQVGVEMMMNSKKHDVEEDNLVMDTKLKIIEIIKVCNTAYGFVVCVGRRIFLFIYFWWRWGVEGE